MRLCPLGMWTCGHLFVVKMTFYEPSDEYDQGQGPLGAAEHLRLDRDGPEEPFRISSRAVSAMPQQH